MLIVPPQYSFWISASIVTPKVTVLWSLFQIFFVDFLQTTGKWRVSSSGMRRRVVQYKFTDVSEAPPSSGSKSKPHETKSPASCWIPQMEEVRRWTLHDVTSQRIELFTVRTVRTSNVIYR
jgi:hypothetical protein